MTKKKSNDSLPSRLTVDSVFNQIDNDDIIHWLKYELKHNKKLRLSFLTNHSTDITTTDIRNKYIRLCRKIKRKYGKNINSHKKLTGSKMYKLFNNLMDQGKDQLSLENYLEAYEIAYAIHLNLYPPLENERLNKKGIECINRAYQLMNWLAESDLPPPLTNKIVEDWTAILDSEQYAVYNAEYNSYKLLFNVFEEEEYLLNILSDQLLERRFSSSFFPTLEIFFMFSHIHDFPKKELNKCVEKVHATHWKKLLKKYRNEKRTGALKYIIENVEMRGEERFDLALIRAKIYYYKTTNNLQKLWNSIIDALELKFDEENLDELVVFLDEHGDEISEDEKEKLHKLEGKMPVKEQWYLLTKTNRYDELLKSLTSYEDAIETIPYMEPLIDDYKKELKEYLAKHIEEHLDSHFGKTGLEHIETLLNDLRSHNYGNLSRDLIRFIESEFKDRPSIEEYLKEKSY